MTPFRPRIYKRRGIWHCAGNGVCGDGYDPAHAYQEWWALVRRKWTTTPLKRIPWEGSWYA